MFAKARTNVHSVMVVEQSDTIKGREKRKTILDAARTAFLADGFHATSMQDLFRASGTSPGAFYRYFPSKTSLVRALASQAIARLSEMVSAAIAAEPTRVADALAPALFAIDDMETTNGGARLAVQIWAEAQRSADLARDVREAVRPMLGAVDRLAEALLTRGVILDWEGDPPNDLLRSGVAAVLAGLLQGYVVQRALFGTSPAVYLSGLHGLIVDRD